MDFRFSTNKENGVRNANNLFEEKSGTLGGKFENNSTESQIATENCECNVLERDFETKRNGCEIHDGCVDALSSTDERTASKYESRKNADVTMDIKLPNCSNSGYIGELEARFGKLLRVGTLRGYNWTDEIPSRPCQLVHAHSRNTQGSSKTIVNQRSVRHLDVCEGTDCFSSGSENSLILIDTFEESVRSQIATFIGCKAKTNIDIKKLACDMFDVAEFGFNHIIIFGEVDFGIIFLDCFGRVFIFEDMNGMTHPLGDSLEEVQKSTIKDIAWFVENGIVYEHIRKPGPVYTDTKGVKKKKSTDPKGVKKKRSSKK